ncbi:MAG: MarR family winged helix-turn-helix transcriptional regulator [Synergistaceae bacterium]|nr:MarR family winged helix-turn-helix transcriptional regulator [Synergistaceae bacterium]
MFLGDDVFFRSLRSIVKKMHRLGDAALSAHGIGHAEMRLLLLLYGEDGRPQESLVAGQVVDRTNVGRSLKKLEELGYVERRKSPEDGRAKLVFLTERGRALQASVLSVKHDIEAKVTSGISGEELRVVSKILEKMDKKLSGGV